MSDRPPFRSWVDDYRARPVRVPPDAIRAALKRRGLMARVASGKSANQATAGARVVMREHEAAVARSNDPVQRAALFLRQRGYVVSREGDAWTAGTRQGLTPEALIALAERIGRQRKE